MFFYQMFQMFPFLKMIYNSIKNIKGCAKMIFWEFAFAKVMTVTLIPVYRGHRTLNSIHT